MGKRGNEPTAEVASRIREAVVLKDTGCFLTEHLIFIPVPDWEGWKKFESGGEETVDHVARWEVFFSSDEKHWWVFLKITWPAITEILLGFVHPDDDKLLERIAWHRRLALVDLPLWGGQPHPLSKGIMVHDIPLDLLRVIGIVPGNTSNSSH